MLWLNDGSGVFTSINVGGSNTDVAPAWADVRSQEALSPAPHLHTHLRPSSRSSSEPNLIATLSQVNNDGHLDLYSSKPSVCRHCTPRLLLLILAMCTCYLIQTVNAHVRHMRLLFQMGCTSTREAVAALCSLNTPNHQPAAIR